MEHAHEGHAGAVEPDVGGISRRTLISGLGAAGAIGLAGPFGGARSVMAVGDVADAIEAPTAGLVYLPLDALAFDVAALDPGAHRIYQPTTGVQPATTTPLTVPPRFLYASLPIPIGSVIRKINVSYVGQPVVAVAQRTLGQSGFPQLFASSTAAVGANPRSQTFSVDIALTAGATYVLEVFCLDAESILGAEVGFIPPAQAFVPFTGGLPRAFDSRDTTIFAANEERVIDLSSTLIPTARAAVINLTATQTGGPGFLAAFADGIAYPGNSSVNFTSANATIANGVVCQMAAGKIKVRTGPAASHVIVDVIGSLL